MKFTDKKISALLDGIFDGTITEYYLPLDYYTAVVDYLKAGLYKGFGMNLTEAIEVGGKDLELLAQLRENIYLFSAAKTFTEVKDISSLFVNENGDVRTKSEFREEALKTYGKYNEDYLTTEYNTTIGQAQSASKWLEFEKNKEILPNLEYSTIGDACDICGPLNGLVAPVDDPIWDEGSPLQHYGCLCLLIAHDEDTPVTEGNEERFAPVLEKMDPMFKNNPGKTGEAFNSEHGYFEAGKADKEFAKQNFGLPIPESDD